MAYDPQLALKCARLSKDVYLTNQASHTDEAFFSINGTQVLMVNDPSVIYVAFRGTTIEDIKTDLKKRQIKTHLGKVHRGFWAYVDHAYNQIIDQYYNWTLSYPKPVIVTGHSLGGAASVIAAARMHSDGIDIESVYNFGCPRVGNHTFKKYADSSFGDRHYRLVNANDFVTRAPLIARRTKQNWHDFKAYLDIDLYCHCGVLYFINVDGKLQAAPNYLSVILNRWSYFKRSPWKWATDGLFDHMIDRYIVALTN